MSLIGKTGVAVIATGMIGLGGTADATHGRGAAIVPSVSATGLLTVDMKSFWRQSSGSPVCTFPHDCITATVRGPGGSVVGSVGPSNGTATLDLSDDRRAEVEQTSTLQLQGAGLYTIDWSSAAWISTVPKVANQSYGTRSTIYWDGNTANAPIIFDLENIQQEVERGVAYSDGLDAIGGGGLTLTYGNTTSGLTSVGVANQATGYSIDASGTINITAAGTSSYTDQPNGGDQAFDGKITATDASGQEQASVEFYWIFDGVDSGTINRAPSVSEITVNALVGDFIDEIVTASDPDGDTVTLSLTNFVGTGGVLPGNALFNAATGQFTWDSTGFGVGTYIATILGSDGSLSDNGTITINLTNNPVNVVPLPAGLGLLSTALLGFGGIRLLRRRQRNSG